MEENKNGMVLSKKSLHLFAGAGGGILGDLLLGREIIGAVELEAYPREVLLSRQADKILPYFPIWDDVTTFRLDNPETKQYIEFLQSIKDDLCICGGFPCFVAGTLILTDKGYKPIEDIIEGDIVLTHKGNWKPVTRTMQRDNAEIWCIKGFGILPTFTTAEHPYYVRRKGEKTSRWLQIRELSNEFYTTMVLPETKDNDKHSEDWWWLAGRYLADGWRVRRKGRKYGRVVIACNDEKSDELERRISMAGFRATRVKERTCNKYHITKGEFYRDLEEFGKGAGGKTLTKRVFELPRNKMQALWDGYMSGDGRKDRIEATTISPSLCLGFAHIAQRLGMECAVYRTERSHHCKIEGRLCNQQDTYTFRYKGNSYASFFDGEILCKRIRQVTNTGNTGTVYNISVADDESYIANGAVVHNCQDLSIAGKQAGLDGERSGLWFEMYRIICEIRPRDIFVENSPMLTLRGLDRVTGDLSKVGYDCKWSVIGADDVKAPHQRKRLWLIGNRK